MSLKPTLSTPSRPLSEATSHLVHRISELVHRLRSLEDEEARLDAQTRQLNKQLQKAEDKTLPSPIKRSISIPVVQWGSPAIEREGSTEGQSTPPHIDPKSVETPIKTFLLMESFALAMSVKSKRKGRLFLGGDSTEFGERSEAIEALRNFP